MSLTGFINFLKPPGMTSHDVISSLRRLFNEKKIGHMGTLDPGASGVLPIAVGSATKIIQYIPEKSKSYRAEMVLGLVSNTGDLFGTVSSFPVPEIPSLESLSEVIKNFVGIIEQKPPMASAVKVGGRKLYEYFRNGMEVDIPKRKVDIFNIKVIDYNYPKLIIDVKCSPGTYIRTLCQDIGNVVNCGAVLSFLVRLESGGFRIDESLTYEEIKSLYERGENFFISAYDMLSDYPFVKLDSDLQDKVIHGNCFSFESGLNDNSIIRLLNEKGEFIAIGRCFHGKIQPEKVFVKL